jgi:AbrB family looped-hinge helix DNA binding protein
MRVFAKKYYCRRADQRVSPHKIRLKCTPAFAIFSKRNTQLHATHPSFFQRLHRLFSLPRLDLRTLAPKRYYDSPIDPCVDIPRCDRHNPSSEENFSVEKARVKVSPKFQVVIPKAIRDELQIESGQHLVMFTLDGSIHLVPSRSVKELRGIAKGMRWKDEYRDRTERF